MAFQLTRESLLRLMEHVASTGATLRNPDDHLRGIYNPVDGSAITIKIEANNLSATDRVWDTIILNGVHCGNRHGGIMAYAFAVADALADVLELPPCDKVEGDTTFNVYYRDAKKIRSR